MANWIKIINQTIKREGGLANRPANQDPGGLTNFGITQSFYEQNGYKGSVKDLTIEKAREFYNKTIVETYRLEERFGYDEWLSEFMFDSIVHHGIKNPISFLQICLACILQDTKIIVDGIWGVNTKLALEKVYDDCKPKVLKEALKVARYTYLWTRPHAGHNPGWFFRVINL
jgi:lysozyme family protein